MHSTGREAAGLGERDQRASDTPHLFFELPVDQTQSLPRTLLNNNKETPNPHQNMLYPASIAKFLHTFLLSIKTASCTDTCINISFLFQRLTELKFTDFGQMESTSIPNHQNIVADEFKTLITYICYRFYMHIHVRIHAFKKKNK